MITHKARLKGNITVVALKTRSCLCFKGDFDHDLITPPMIISITYMYTLYLKYIITYKARLKGGIAGVALVVIVPRGWRRQFGASQHSHRDQLLMYNNKNNDDI